MDQGRVFSGARTLSLKNCGEAHYNEIKNHNFYSIETIIVNKNIK